VERWWCSRGEAGDASGAEARAHGRRSLAVKQQGGRKGKGGAASDPWGQGSNGSAGKVKGHVMCGQRGSELGWATLWAS
jgi:hypothetical protein